MSTKQQTHVSLRHGNDAAQMCIVCGSTTVTSFIEIPRAPVQCNVLWVSRERALNAPCGAIKLGFCGSCGHIANMAYDPDLIEYTETYENSLHFSPRFQRFVDSLVARLDNEYALHDKRVIDVGCGKGEFLETLCERTGCFGTGFDRSYEPALNPRHRHSKKVTFIVDFYGDRYASYPVDLITCRHVLEHIDRPAEFVSMIRRTIGARPDTAVYFEMPDAMFTVKDMGIWDIIYEHVSYFTPQSLATIFEQNGFEVARLTSDFDGQYLTLDAVPRAEGLENTARDVRAIREIEHDISKFQERYDSKVREWRQTFEKMHQAGSKVVIWGTGSKGVTFLNVLGVTDSVPYAVDINPRKSGLHVPGTGQRVVPPSFLSTYQPDVVIVMNQIYEDEINQTLASLGVSADVVIA